MREKLESLTLEQLKEMAKEKGLIINFVLTVTDYSKDYSDEIYEFFKSEKMNLKIHMASDEISEISYASSSGIR